MIFSGSRTPVWDRCVSTDTTGKTTRRTSHDDRFVARGTRRVQVCQNCGRQK